MTKKITKKITSALTSELKAKLIYKACEDKKAIDLVCLDVSKLSSVADYFVIATGTSDRHVKAMGEAVIDCLRALGEKPQHREGLEEGMWALLDSHDVMVHIFQETTRTFYGLEGVWHKAKKVKFG